MGQTGRNESVLRCFDVLEVVGQRDGVTPSAVATELDVPVSTTHRNLKTLESVGAIVGERGRYYPSLVSLRFVRGVERWTEIQSVVAELRETSTSLRFAVSFLVEESGSGVCVFASGSETSYRLGDRVSLTADFAGQTFLASLPPAERETFLDDADDSLPDSFDVERVAKSGMRLDRVETRLLRTAVPVTARSEPVGVLCAEDPDGLLSEVPGQLRRIADDLAQEW
jgi:DNA-binding IclR family transcriptional regulator